MKNIKICIITLMMLFLVACGKKDESKEKDLSKISTEEVASQSSAQNSDTTEEVKTEETTEVAYKEPDETKMASDIDKFGGNQITFMDGDCYTLETKAVVINKASKEDKSFIVYCTAAQENDLFTAENSYILTYNFYEIGGWILDYCTLDTINMTPKCIVPKIDVENYLSMMGYTTYEYQNDEKESDTSYNYYYSARTEYPYMDVVYNITVSCQYDNTNGWEIYSYETSYYNDWSKIYGTWYTEYYDGDILHTCTVDIKNIDEQAGTITLDLTTTSDSPRGISGTNGQNIITSNDILATIQYETTPTALSEGCEYNSRVVYYYHTTETGRVVEHSYDLYWGRNVGMYRVYCLDTFISGYLQKVE